MKRLITWGTLALPFVVATGCAGPDASRTITRERIESGQLVQPDELRVAEYLNYYDQSFPEPAAGQVGLDVRLGNVRVPAEGGDAWLQVGLQARSDSFEEIAPLNLALVLDVSGSMADNDKLPYLKAAIATLTASLAPNDIVTLVTYSDEARVLHSGRSVGDGRWVVEAAERLRASGSTNLHSGLMAGLQSVDDAFDIRRNNLVILFTDGIANVGVVDADAIAAAGATYTERGIRIAAIGLGNEFNDELLARLAEESDGAYHFVDRPDELERVFQDSVSGMLQKVATDVLVTLRPGSGVRLVSVTGADSIPSGPFTVRLNDMGTGDSQIILVELDVSRSSPGPRTLATVELQYADEFTQRHDTHVREAVADVQHDESYDPLWDTEVLRNVVIQRSAEGLRSINEMYDRGHYAEAYELANRLEADLLEVAALTGEEQMYEDAALLRRYQETLSQWVDGDSYVLPERIPAREYPAPLRRGRLPTPTGPIIDIR